MPDVNEELDFTERPEPLISRKQYYEDFKVRLQIHNAEFSEIVVEVGNFINWTKPHLERVRTAVVAQYDKLAPSTDQQPVEKVSQGQPDSSGSDVE